MSDTLSRATRYNRCPICNSGQWCYGTADGSTWTCMKVEAGSFQQAKNGGFIHRLAGGASAPRIRGCRATIRLSNSTDMGPRMEGYRAALWTTRLNDLVDQLGVSAANLERLGIGWAADNGKPGVFDAGDAIRGGGCYAFPMSDAEGRVVGIRLRFPDGRKLAVTGGREGLFVPSGLKRLEAMLITEGPTDCAALLDLGFPAVGRPSCTGGTKMLVQQVRRLRPASIVIVADADTPGQRGAALLATSLSLYVPRLRILTPPAGIKDARAWKQSGATTVDVATAILDAPVHGLKINGRAAQKEAACV